MILTRLLQASVLPTARPLDAVLDDGSAAVLASNGMLVQYLALRANQSITSPVKQSEFVQMQAWAQESMARQQRKLITSLHDALAGTEVRIGLLKGMAMAYSLYPTPACRPMADLDLFVTRNDAPIVRQALYGLGFEEYTGIYAPAQDCDHHEEPLRNPTTGLWVEIHTALFPSGNLLSTRPLFQAHNLRWKPLLIEGREFQIMEPALAVIYVAAHWAQMVQPQGKFHGLLDVALLQKTLSNEELGTAIARVRDRQLARTLWIAFAMLRRAGIRWMASPEVQQDLKVRADIAGLRSTLLVNMAYQVVLQERGIFHVLGRHVAAQWWSALMESDFTISALLSMGWRLLVPKDYGGLRGWALQKHRLLALLNRLRKRDLPV